MCSDVSSRNGNLIVYRKTERLAGISGEAFVFRGVICAERNERIGRVRYLE